MLLAVQQGLAQDGFKVSLVKLCRWFEFPRRTLYYRPSKAAPIVQDRFAQPIKVMIEENPSFGYRPVAHFLGFNKNTVQRVLQIEGWQVRAPRRVLPAHPGITLGDQGARRKLGDGSMPGAKAGRRWRW